MKHDEHYYKAEELVALCAAGSSWDELTELVAQALRDAERYGAAQAGKAKRSKAIHSDVKK